MQLTDLWMPIVLAAVFVFVASSILHMILPLHRKDMQKLSGEDKILDAIRGQNNPPGDYMFPFPNSMKEMGSPEMLEKYKQGPVGLLTVMPSGVPAIGKNLLQWFVYCLVVETLVAYVGQVSLAAGTDYMTVFRVTATAAILAYGVGYVPNSIWKGTSWSTTFKFLIDGVVYGLVTGGTFGWLWPAAA